MTETLDIAEVAKDQTDKARLSADEIAEILETDIVFGCLHPRERLVESALQHRFEATRHAVRNAISQLVSLGIVEYQKNIGAMVKSYTRQEVMDLYDLRAVLETSAAQRIRFPVSEESLQTLKQIQAKHDQAIAARDRSATFRANILFHKALFDLTGNALLSAAIEESARKAHIIRFRSMVDARFLSLAQQEHQDIIRALEQQDRDSLVRLCGQHLTPSRDAYLESVSDARTF